MVSSCRAWLKAQFGRNSKKNGEGEDKSTTAPPGVMLAVNDLIIDQFRAHEIGINRTD